MARMLISFSSIDPDTGSESDEVPSEAVEITRNVISICFYSLYTNIRITK